MGCAAQILSLLAILAAAPADLPGTLRTSIRGGLVGKRARLSRKSAVASVALMMTSFRGGPLPCSASRRRSGTMRDSSPAVRLDELGGTEGVRGQALSWAATSLAQI